MHDAGSRAVGGRARVALLLVSAWLAGVASAAPAVPPDAFPQVARAYWVEVDGRPLWAGQADTRLPMASLTKLMTALILAEDADLEATVVTSAGLARGTCSTRCSCVRRTTRAVRSPTGTPATRPHSSSR